MNTCSTVTTWPLARMKPVAHALPLVFMKPVAHAAFPMPLVRIIHLHIYLSCHGQRPTEPVLKEAAVKEAAMKEGLLQEGARGPLSA